MNLSLRRLVLTSFALTGVYTGLWAYFAPRRWHDRFPGFGHSWLPQLGPYNEHLAKDTGAMFLALTVLSLLALCYVRDNVVVRTTGLVWLTFNVLHLSYHMQHLDMYGKLDQILNVATLGLLALGSVVLLLPVPQRREAVKS